MYNIYTVVSIPSTNLFHVKVQEELHDSKRWNERAEESSNPEDTKQNTDIGRMSPASVSASCLNNNHIFFDQHKVRTKAEPRNSIIKLKLRLSICTC